MAKLLWYRTDLRIQDHPILDQYQKEVLLPFYCFDENQYTETHLGFPKTGAFRAQFIMEAVANLKASLQELGSNLFIGKGDTKDQIKHLTEQFQIDEILYFRGLTREEIELEEKVAALGIPMRGFDEHLLFQLEDLPFSQEQVPFIFTDYRKKVEKFCKVRPELKRPLKLIAPELEDWGQMPSIEDLGLESTEADRRAVMPFKGGENEAWRRLNTYIWEQDLLKVYKENRNGMLGADYSSKFSPWLAQGCISAVSIYWEVKRYERERISNSSTYWLIFELMWRDFFKITAWSEGNSFFKVPYTFEPKAFKKFEKWRTGTCGNDFVDAHMRELLHTGFMSNRGRQNVASYLVHNLKEHWYLGAMWFESQLIDYDVCSNYGNWTYVAGQGHDPRSRVFNMQRQADMYDPEGEFRKFWLES